LTTPRDAKKQGILHCFFIKKELQKKATSLEMGLV